MDIEEHYEEVRSIVEGCHCSGCSGFADPEMDIEKCDFSSRVDDVMERLVEYGKEVE